MVTTVIRIRTPRGQATKTQKQLRPFIMGRTAHTVEINKEDNEITWTFTTSLRRSMKITKNVARFDYIMKGVLGNKKMKKYVKNKMGADSLSELEDMLLNQTSIEVVRQE